MKKYTFILALFAVLTSMASCRKVHTCTCTNVTGNSKTTASESSDGRLTRREAKKWCEDNEGSFSYGSFSSTTTCELD